MWYMFDVPNLMMKDWFYYEEREDRIMYKFDRVVLGRGWRLTLWFVVRDLRYMWE
jgi:hypothetical protein